MTTPPPPPPRHRAVVAAALEDWWLHADPALPFDPADAAVQIDMYLHSSGYTIAPDLDWTRPMPSRLAIAALIVLAAVCTASVALALWHGDWEWAALGALGTALLIWETFRDISDRRRRRPAR